MAELFRADLSLFTKESLGLGGISLGLEASYVASSSMGGSVLRTQVTQGGGDE